MWKKLKVKWETEEVCGQKRTRKEGPVRGCE